MNKIDERYKSMSPCTRCGAQPRPMSMSLCGSWECGSYVDPHGDEYTIHHSDWCDHMATVITTIGLHPKDWITIVDALEYRANSIDGNAQHIDIMDRIKETMQPYFTRLQVTK